MLDELVREAEEDPDTLALVLAGSRAVAHERPDSDYDLYYVRTSTEKPPPRPNVDAAVTTLDELRSLEPSWWTDGLVAGRVLVDKTGGALAAELERLAREDDAHAAYDAYLNALVRGLASVRRGDELGARLHAADSVRYLARALHALDGRRAPFHDRLAGTLGEWEPRLLDILRAPSRDLQRELFRDVRTLMASRGVLAHRAWTKDLDRL